MIRRLRCFLRSNRGSLSVESMLALPALLLALFLCVGVITCIRNVMILDQALAETCEELAENSYLLQQAWGLGMELLPDDALVNALAETLADTQTARGLYGHMLAANCLTKRLKEHPALTACVTWRQALLPGLPGKEDEGMADTAFGETQTFDKDDVVLALSFTPAGVNRFTSLLPGSWQITIAKRQRAWLTGRNLLPGRGLEQSAGQKEKGPMVYITRWGVKYHQEACRYLAKSKIPAWLSQLSEAYGACLICKPPQR